MKTKRNSLKKIIQGAFGLGLFGGVISTVGSITVDNEQFTENVTLSGNDLEDQFALNSKVQSNYEKFSTTKSESYTEENFDPRKIEGAGEPVIASESDFRVALGFAHSERGGRGWHNLFWGNQYILKNSNAVNTNIATGQKGLGSEYFTGNHGRAYYVDSKTDGYIAKRNFGNYYNQHPELTPENYFGHTRNEAAVDSTLEGDNYKLRMNYDGYDGGAIWSAHIASNFHTDMKPSNNIKDKDSAFLLFLYSMLATQTGELFTGDITMDTAPELLWIDPVIEIAQSSSDFPLSWETALAGTAGVITEAGIGAALGGGVAGSAIGGSAAFISSIVVPVVEGALQGSVSSIKNVPKDFIPLSGIKSFLYNSTQKIRSNYIQNPDYNINNFFFTDINLGMDMQTKMYYDGWTGNHPSLEVFTPTVELTYHMSGTHKVLHSEEPSVQIVNEKINS